MSGTADLLRRGLWPLSLLYAAVAALRNRAFDAGVLARYALDVPVVSVGNLTVGGTGKTPLVVWLLERALAAGRRPGVLARGYGRAPGAALNDEGLLLAARFPGLPQVQDADRVAGGRRLCVEHGVDLVVLDDGFQHRRLRRDVDLVCMDAERPFASGLVLPAGDLREARRGLRRADVVVLTRASGLDVASLAERAARLRRVAGRDVPVFATEHEPTDVVEQPSGARHTPAWLRGRRVHLLSAIARPRTFEATVAATGAEIAGHTVRRDHHVHQPGDVAAIAADAAARGATLLVTEKDAVKLAGVAAPFAVLRIGLRFLGEEPRLEEVGLA